jgi:hypothetical protein
MANAGVTSIAAANLVRKAVVLVSSLLFFLTILASAMNDGSAMAQPFKPIRELSSWYTDRSLIDIEIIGSTSLLPDSHRLEPDRVLRFRLERAYVQTLITQSSPGYELVSLALDSETGLAESLLTASANRGQYHEDIPGVPALPRAEILQGGIRLSLRSDLSRSGVEARSERTKQCLGAPLDDGLIAYKPQQKPGCFLPSYRRGRQYAAQYGDLLLKIECEDEDPRRRACKTQFPFESFGVDITFHIGKLPKWRALIEQAAAFLKSKQF